MGIVLVGTILLSLTGSEIMALSPLDRARACKELPGIDDPTARLLAPFSASLGLQVRNFLKIHGVDVPSPSRWFSEPKIHISITQRRVTRKEGPDSVDFLLSVHPPRDPKLAAALGEALIRGCIIRKLGDDPRPGVPTALLEAAFHPLTFVHRKLITRTLEEMGPIIVPELLPWTRKSFSKERNRMGYLKVKYATYVLRSSVAGTPRLALQSAPRDLRLKLIDLYGKYRVAQAIKPLLRLARSDDEEVAARARAALLSYFDGPRLERGAIGTIKLPGGVETTAVLYYSARQQAYHAIRKAMEEATRGDYDRTLRGKALARKLFRVWDELKARRWELEFARAYRRYAAGGDVEAAARDFMDVLAHDPSVKGRELAAPVFREMARRALARGDVRGAIEYARLALLVSPDRALEADLYYMMGLVTEAEGDRAGAVALYRHALDLVPGHVHAFAALWNVDPIPHTNEGPVQWGAVVVSVLVSLMALLALAWRS